MPYLLLAPVIVAGRCHLSGSLSLYVSGCLRTPANSVSVSVGCILRRPVLFSLAIASFRACISAFGGKLGRLALVRAGRERCVFDQCALACPLR